MRTPTILAVAALCGSAAFLWTLYQRAPREDEGQSAAAAAMSARRTQFAMVANDRPRDREKLVKWLENNPSSYDGYFDLANLLEGAGDRDVARDAWGKVRDIAGTIRESNPQEIRATFMYAWASDKLGKADEAGRAFAEADRLYGPVVGVNGRFQSSHTAVARYGWCRRKLGDEQGARSAWHRAAELLERSGPEGMGPEDAYNLACYRALAGDRESALQWLESAVTRGYAEPEWALGDDDLMNLRGEPRFQEVVAKMAEAKARKESGE
jgi:tetratricopeptide (TPR) repeat protein